MSNADVYVYRKHRDMKFENAQEAINLIVENEEFIKEIHGDDRLKIQTALETIAARAYLNDNIGSFREMLDILINYTQTTEGKNIRIRFQS